MKYVHNGSPLLDEDTVMLRVYRSGKIMETFNHCQNLDEQEVKAINKLNMGLRLSSNVMFGVCVEVHVLRHADGDGGPAGASGEVQVQRGAAGQRSSGGASVLRFVQRHRQLRAEHQNATGSGLHGQTDDLRHRRPLTGPARQRGGVHSEEGYVSSSRLSGNQYGPIDS